MKIVLAGTDRDLRGFALAGVEGHAIRDAAAARLFLESPAATAPDVGLLLLSAETARQAMEEVARLVRKGPPPAVLVLPETGR